MVKKSSWSQPTKKVYQSPNPILRMVPVAPKVSPKKKKRTPANRSSVRQYGDKGYMPSSGKGVGY